MKEFVARARGVSLGAVADRLEIPQPPKGKPDYEGPCPRCGGTDRFAVNRGKSKWLCRGCGTGGRDAIGLAAHVLHLDMRTRSGFLEACAAVLDEDVPAGGERETDEERAARKKRIAEAEDRAARNRKAQEEQGNIFREKEIQKARGFWFYAVDCRKSGDDARRGRIQVRDYLRARTGYTVPDAIFANLRVRLACGYYFGEDDLGRPCEIYSGPAIIAPIVDPADQVIGCHMTWTDLGNRKGKSRPVLWGLTKEGVKAGKPPLHEGGRLRPPSTADIEAGFYARLKTKKMRGRKTGGLIPLLGEPEAARWLGGEGYENVLAIAGTEGFRKDTFYFSAGDLGNLAGPADPDSAFLHPTLKKQAANGQWRRIRIAGPVPRKDLKPDEALQVPGHVRELLMVADGDSEPVWTASAMARAQARLSRPDLDITSLWPPEGQDFSGAISAAIAGDDSE
ncbi:primase-helicase zinc-binding domain-containing protein [Rhizobium straminoryzae]|uniref:primase-helicase zinc-binding domain-containing protein n=1 Tax=Rhizobium straminoryzae TaxID=1387186 RepID=UPI00163D3FD1|nr:primase-helicase zinc-binding domain-containing protein [Rhizobium straminoryzae]